MRQPVVVAISIVCMVRIYLALALFWILNMFTFHRHLAAASSSSSTPTTPEASIHLDFTRSIASLFTLPVSLTIPLPDIFMARNRPLAYLTRYSLLVGKTHTASLLLPAKMGPRKTNWSL